MTVSKRVPPPLSPVLLAGLLARRLPLRLLQPALNMAMHAVQKKHPDLFDRLSGLRDPVYLVDPTDLPFMFLLDPNPVAPTLRAVSNADDAAVTATIRGPLLKLIELLEGRIDGDSLFFSRALVIEGDTEAVVALRNAVDGAEIDVREDVLSLVGPISGPLRFIGGLAEGAFMRVSEDLEVLRAAAVAPVVRKADSHTAELKDLEEKMTELRRQARSTLKPRRPVPRKPRKGADPEENS